MPINATNPGINPLFNNNSASNIGKNEGNMGGRKFSPFPLILFPLAILYTIFQSLGNASEKKPKLPNASPMDSTRPMVQNTAKKTEALTPQVLNSTAPSAEKPAASAAPKAPPPPAASSPPKASPPPSEKPAASAVPEAPPPPAASSTPKASPPPSEKPAASTAPKPDEDLAKGVLARRGSFELDVEEEDVSDLAPQAEPKAPEPHKAATAPQSKVSTEKATPPPNKDALLKQIQERMRLRSTPKPETAKPPPSSNFQFNEELLRRASEAESQAGDVQNDDDWE